MSKIAISATATALAVGFFSAQVLQGEPRSLGDGAQGDLARCDAASPARRVVRSCDDSDRQRQLAVADLVEQVEQRDAVIAELNAELEPLRELKRLVDFVNSTYECGAGMRSVEVDALRKVYCEWERVPGETTESEWAYLLANACDSEAIRESAKKRHARLLRQITLSAEEKRQRREALLDALACLYPDTYQDKIRWLREETKGFLAKGSFHHALYRDHHPNEYMLIDGLDLVGEAGNPGLYD